MPTTLFVICANIVIFAHVQSFVLLTANFDDVKKLAQKFVSESLAEKIAEFVAKASLNKIGLKLSKEEEPKEKEFTIKSDSESEDKENETTKESISKENMKYKSKVMKKTPKHKTRFESKSSVKRSKKSRNDIKLKSKEKEVNFKPETNNLNDFSDDSAVNNVSIESTAGWVEEGLLGKNLTSDQEETESEYVFRFNEIEGMNGLFRDETKLTTRKERNEFDQYENTYYPKAVGTSGSVTLRLLDARKSRYRKD